MPLNLLCRLFFIQLYVVVILVAGQAAFLLLVPGQEPSLWWLEPPIAMALALLYAWLGLVLVQGRPSLKRLVLRHVFRTLVVGMLLVVLPLVLLERISLVTIGSFMLIHLIGWWWVFGRKRALGRYAWR